MEEAVAREVSLLVEVQPTTTININSFDKHLAAMRKSFVKASRKPNFTAACGHWFGSVWFLSRVPGMILPGCRYQVQQYRPADNKVPSEDIMLTFVERYYGGP